MAGAVHWVLCETETPNYHSLLTDRQRCKKDWELPAIFAKLMGSCCLCTMRTRCKPGFKKSYNSASEKVNVLSGGGCVSQPYSGHWHTGRGRPKSSPKKHVIQRSNTTWILTGKHHCPLLFPIEWCSIRTVLGKKYWALDFCHGWIEWDMAKRAFTVGKSSSLYVHLFLSGFLFDIWNWKWWFSSRFVLTLRGTFIALQSLKLISFWIMNPWTQTFRIWKVYQILVYKWKS